MEKTLKNKLMEKLKEIIDPHTGINIVDMGLLKEMKDEGDKVIVKFAPTSPWCPIVGYFVEEIKNRALKVGFKECSVEIVD